MKLTKLDLICFLQIHVPMILMHSSVHFHQKKQTPLLLFLLIQWLTKKIFYLDYLGVSRCLNLQQFKREKF